MWNRVLASFVLVGSVLLACGGRTDDLHASSSGSGGSSGGGSGGGSGGSSGGGSGGSSGGGSGSSSGISGSSSGVSSSSSGGPACVYVDPSTYDTSCNQASDCVYVTTGEVCDGYCQGCGNTLINQDGLARYDQTVASIVVGQCGCDLQVPPSCVNHQCASEGPDGGPPDGGTCVYVDPSSFDHSCNVDSDCTSILSGDICSGQCDCGGNTAINVDGESQYQDDVAGIAFLGCPCPAPPPTVCVAGTCELGPISAGRAHR